MPCDPFVSEETDEKIKLLVQSAHECGCNMLRVWGGGVFEKDSFYSECDRLGILVTQDFLMALAEPTRRMIRIFLINYPARPPLPQSGSEIIRALFGGAVTTKTP